MKKVYPCGSQPKNMQQLLDAVNKYNPKGTKKKPLPHIVHKPSNQY